MSKTGKAMVGYHRAASMSVTCPICDVRPGQHCHQRHKRPTRETHQARVVAWEKAVAYTINLNKKEQQQ